MTKFDDDILRCLFNKRYMDFRTCSNLRSVSTRFNFFAAKYCLSLKELDISDLSKAFNKHHESSEKFYPCLIETVAKYCPNLWKIAGVRVISRRLNFLSRNCLESVPHLTSVTFDHKYIDMSILYNFLKRLPRLQSVKVNSIDDKYGSFRDVPEEKKIAVSELSLEFGDFWRVFRVSYFKRISGLSAAFEYDTTKFDEFKAALARCLNLEQLELELDIYQSDSMSFQSKFRKVQEVLLLDLERLTVNIKLCSSLEIANESLRRFPRVWQHMKNLELLSTAPTGSC